MYVYRIAKEKYINDLTGTGAKMVGGRWNPKGVPILYTSSSVSLAILEVLAHLPPAYFPNDMWMATIDIPEQLIQRTTMDVLPEDWNHVPPRISSQKYTESWFSEGVFLGIEVPSIISPIEKNILINPLHKNFNQVKMITSEPFSFDRRLINV